MKLVTDQGYSVTEAARIPGIGSNLLHRWKTKFGRSLLPKRVVMTCRTMNGWNRVCCVRRTSVCGWSAKLHLWICQFDGVRFSRSLLLENSFSAEAGGSSELRLLELENSSDFVEAALCGLETRRSWGHGDRG